MFPARFHVRRRRNDTVSGTVCTTTSTTTLLLLCIVFHAFTCATAGVPGEPAFTHIQHTDNEWQLLLNIEPPSGNASTAADFYYNVTVQRKIPIPKWTLNLSATGGKKEFEGIGPVLTAPHHSGLYTLNEPGFRINTITAPTSLKYPRCWLPLKFGRSGSKGGGLGIWGGIRGVHDIFKIRNAPFKKITASEQWSPYYNAPSYNWVATQTNTTVKVRTGICNGTPQQESLLCTSDNVGAPVSHVMKKKWNFTLLLSSILHGLTKTN